MGLAERKRRRATVNERTTNSLTSRARCSTMAYLKSIQELRTMRDIVQIPLPLPHVGSVNAWLLRGEPLTL